MAAFGDDAEVFADKVEQGLMSIDEVFIYRVPPLRTAGGHRADDWGLGTPLLTGSMKIVQRGDECFVRLYEPTQGALFATCPVRIAAKAKPGEESGLSAAYEAVVDSSRYFVLRCEDERKRTA